MTKLDTARFCKVYALIRQGATDGERSAAKIQASKIAAKAGLTLEQAASEMDKAASPKPVNIFEGFDDWMEAKEPGWIAKRAKEKTEREHRDEIRRAEVLAAYGSEAALFARTEMEALLAKAVEPLATKWDFWTDGDGNEHRFAEELQGNRPMFWDIEHQTPDIREAVSNAYPWPSTLDAALQEVRDWDRLRHDRALFSGGEWNHYAEVYCRISLLEHALDCGQAAASWDDMQARLDWKRYQFECQWIDPTQRNDAFLDRVEADLAAMKTIYGRVQSGRRTNADKRLDILSMLDAHPDLSDREIARRTGVSPQSVNTWRKRNSA